MIKNILTLLLAAFAGNALATNINIDYGYTGCTLADAIKSANRDNAVGQCASGSGTDYLIAPDGLVVTLSSALPTITSDMTIRSSSEAGVLTIIGAGNFRLMKITGQNTDVTLRRVIFQGGSDFNLLSGWGAGIRIENATVRLEDSTLFQFVGAGIGVIGGNLTIDRSTLRDSDPGWGLSIMARNSAYVHFVDSAIKNPVGEGMTIVDSTVLVERSLIDTHSYPLYGHNAVLDIVNSTISSTYARSNLRALEFDNGSSVTLNHVTMDRAFKLDDSSLGISNSVHAGCLLTGTSITRDTGNLQQISNSDNGDVDCLSNSPQEVYLLPLTDNGGPTMTRAIGNPDSPLINAGNPAHCELLDQRGEARGAACDVGAYEATGYADVAVTATTEPGAPYASEQHIVVVAELRNVGPGPATNLLFDIDADRAYVTGVDSVYCTAIPCVIGSIQPGQTMEIRVEMDLDRYYNSPFSMDISAHTTANSTYEDADEDDPSGNNFFSLSGVINQSADLALTMDLVTAGPYYVGQTIQYQAHIDNAGPQTASGTQLTFDPEHLKNIVFSGCASVSGLICNVSNIGSGQSRTVGIQAKIDNDQFNAVGSVQATQVDLNPDDNIDDRNNGGGVSESDIAIKAKVLSSAPYYSYDYVEISISITTGNEPASNIQLDYDFPGAEFINIQPCGGFPCIIPQLAANSEITLLAQFFAPIAIPGALDTLDFHVEAWPGQSDTKPVDNEATLTKDLYPVADVGPQLTLVSTPPFYAGQSIQYALQVVNGGINAANSVQVTVNPQNLSLLSSYGDLCQTAPCTISRLNAFDQENITLIYQIDNAGAFDLSASAHANEHDSVPGNNTDSSSNGGTAFERPTSDLIFADGFE